MGISSHQRQHRTMFQEFLVSNYTSREGNFKTKQAGEGNEDHGFGTGKEKQGAFCNHQR